MANEKRVRNNNVQGTLSSTMNSTGTTINSAGLANLEAISSTEHAAIIIDPGRTAGAPEIVHVTAHTGSATSATVTRGREGTAARAHSSTEEWVHAPTATIDYLPFRPPSAKVHRDAAQVIGTGAWTAIQFDVEKWDTDTIWSSTANERFNINTAGKYICEFGGMFAASSAGTFRGVLIQIDSTAESGASEGKMVIDQTADYAGSGVDIGLSVSDSFQLTSTQFVSFLVIHNVGSNLNTSTALNKQFRASVRWVSS